MPFIKKPIKVLRNFRNFIALNVYLAMCYYKLDYYDISQVRCILLLKFSSYLKIKKASFVDI